MRQIVCRISSLPLSHVTNLPDFLIPLLLPRNFLPVTHGIVFSLPTGLDLHCFFISFTSVTPLVSVAHNNISQETKRNGNKRSGNVYSKIWYCIYSMFPLCLCRRCLYINDLDFHLLWTKHRVSQLQMGPTFIKKYYSNFQ
jgi:hypothetical protein